MKNSRLVELVDYLSVERVEKLYINYTNFKGLAELGDTNCICIVADLDRALDFIDGDEKFVVIESLIRGRTYREVAKELEPGVQGKERSIKYVHTTIKGAVWELCMALNSRELWGKGVNNEKMV